MNKFAIFIFNIYQLIFSKIIGSNKCRFYPSCSNYAIEAFAHFSFFKAAKMTITRIIRCHPFNPGGYDPLIKKSDNKQD